MGECMTASSDMTNKLYYGDNLDILRRYIPDESVDLVYLDPPFNSNRDYNVIFKDESGNNTDAQLVAFEDTWHWGPDAEKQYNYLTNTALNEGRVPEQVSTIVGALRHGIGTNQMMAYLVEMTARLVELHRVLKPTGSLYLHCDPTASHYLKIILDSVFTPQCFMSELIWKRTSAHSSAKRYGPVHDSVLVYTASSHFTWNQQYTAHDPAYVKSHYGQIDADGRRWTASDLTAAGTRNGSSGQPWRGYDPAAKGNHWKFTLENLERLDTEGRIYWPAAGGWPRYRRYLDEVKGTPLQDVWTDIPPVNAKAAERLGYPTQKPLDLLERMILASSNPGDIVLDPFCGCGTALVAAEKLDRKWVGIDITYLSIAVMKARLANSFALTDIEVVGQPTEVEGARGLAQAPNTDGRYQFQWWALGLVDARPVGGVKKKGADSGIDGVISFTDEGGKLERVIVSVKSGHVNRGMISDLRGVMEREGAAIALFVTLEEPSRPMKDEAATAGHFHSEVWNRDYQRIQILSIRELLEEHKRPDLPAFVHQPYQQAERQSASIAAEQGNLFGDH